jgi:chaperonin cofactor prefoldin
MASEEYEETLKANLRRLSEIGTGIDELREKSFQKINEHELAIHRLNNLCRDLASKDELKEIRESISSLEKRISSFEDSMRENIKRLSKIDSEIIDELAKLQGVFASLSEAKVERVEVPKKPKPEEDRLTSLEKERDKLLATLGKLTEDFNAGLISKKAYEEALKGGEGRLSEIEEEIEKLRK